MTEVTTTQEEFQALISEFLEKGVQGTVSIIADEFEVAQSTVERWSRGIARPHPRVRQMVANFVQCSRCGRAKCGLGVSHSTGKSYIWCANKPCFNGW